MSSRLFPINLELFASVIEPLIFAHYERPGHPPQGDHVWTCRWMQEEF